MPEYLAPGVYVEETSFRAKSIEGVGTSTTAFVGPTRRGPIVSTQNDAAGNPPAAPELLTSFGDFERLFGGLEDLAFGPPNPPTVLTNYLAHSVLQFFNEGGSRLYVARVANQPSPATSERLPAGAAANESVFIRSRFGGAAVNGRATIAEIARPTTVGQLDSYIDGSFLRVSDPTAAPASLEGGPLPADLTGVGPGNIVLNLTVNGTDQAVGFAARPATIEGIADLPDPVVIGPTEREFRVRVNGLLQVVQLQAGSTARAAFLTALAGLLTGVTVTLKPASLSPSAHRSFMTAQVLIVGAGPGGVTLAAECLRHGVNFRIVDQAEGPSNHSKALAVPPCFQLTGRSAAARR